MFDYGKRLKNLKRLLRKGPAGSLLVTNESNVAYLSGFTGNDSLLFITPDSQFFLTDSRYTQEAKETVKGFTIIEVTSSTYETIGTIVRGNRIKKIGFDPMNLPYGIVKNLERHVGGVRLVPVTNVIERLRAVKDDEEIARIEKAIKINAGVLKKIVKEVRPGVSEEYISGRIGCEFIKNGAMAGFQTIVACGKNSAKPHAHPTADKIAKNDAVMIDMGCRLDMYNSDMTRMVFIGEIKTRFKEIYTIVKTAQEKALEKIKSGRRVSEVDSAGRQYIADKGYGKFFGHSLGHGIGLDVHEEPSVSCRSTDILVPGMVFTVEPAIYIPGFGGVRIEDIVLVTKTGYKILTR